MDNLPAFLDTKIAAIEPGSIDDPAAPYQPLIAIWLLEMALALGWYRRAQRDRAVDVFRNDFFRQCTGIPSSGEGGDDQDENVPEFLRKPRTRRVADATLARQLTQALAKARRQPLAPDLPLFRNVELLGGLLGLNDAEKAIVAYFVTLQAFHPFLEIVSAQDSKLNRASVIRLLSILLGRPDGEIAAALHEEATLSTARILWLDWDHDCLDQQMNLISGLAAAMLAPQAEHGWRPAAFDCERAVLPDRNAGDSLAESLARARPTAPQPAPTTSRKHPARRCRSTAPDTSRRSRTGSPSRRSCSKQPARPRCGRQSSTLSGPVPGWSI